MSEQKKILVSIPDLLLREIDEYAKSNKMSRSEFIREVLRDKIQEKKRIQMQKQMKKGYIEMGKINLEIAEMCFEADCGISDSYEEKLAECE